MVKIHHAVATRARKKKVLKRAKGQFGHRSRRYQQAKRSLINSLLYHYRDRKVHKREFRRLWILRINAACKEVGMTYSRFIKGLVDAQVSINRKMLADLVVHSPEAFRSLVKVAQEAKPAESKKASAQSEKTKK